MKRSFLSILTALIMILCGNLLLSNESANAMSSVRYYGEVNYSETDPGSNITYVTYDIYYDSYEMDDTHLERLCPNYENVNHVNSCAPMAATIIVGYYDYEFENLVPNYSTCYYYNGTYGYRPRSSEVQDVKDQLYTLMGTNTESPGTSVAQFKSGFTSYVNSKGLNISYNSCGNTFNLQTAINYLNQGQPIAVFVSGYEYFPEVGLYREDGHFSMGGRSSTNTHVFVAYGYRQYRYYDENGLFKTENYLVVVFGDGTQGLLSIDRVTNIDEAYAIDIY